MQKNILRTILWILTGSLLLGMVGCTPKLPTDPTPTPSDTDPLPSDTPPVTGTPTPEAKNSDITLREYTIKKGTALHTEAQLPDEFTETVNRFMTQYDSIAVDGYVSTFQTSTTYRATQRINTEAVMAYVTTKDALKTTLKSWYAVDDVYSINLMMPINRDSNDYVKRDSDNYNDIQTDKNGKYITHSTSSSVYYMVPSKGWIEYIWEIVEEALTNYSLDSITFEEPEMWYASGYSQTFKDEWEEYYGEPWEEQTSSPAAMLKTMRLKVYLFDRILSEIAERAHELSPDTKIYVASHSTASYTSISITAGLNQYLATGTIDGVIGQTWSNTASVSMPQNGASVVKEYENAYLGYASYADAAGNLDLFAITDTMADGDAWTEAQCFPKYRATLVSALMQSEIHRFEAAVWPSRGFEPVSRDYKTIQLSCYQAINEMSGKEILTSAGTPGIAYLLSDSLSWQLGSSWAPSSVQSYYGVTLPLVCDGIPLAIKSMENVKTKDDLKDVNILLLAFDCQKPVREEIVDAIVAWVEDGGVLLYIGGYDVFSESDAEWWASYGSPVNALLKKLGSNATLVKKSDKNFSLPADIKLSYQSSLANFYASFSENEKQSDYIEFSAGDGYVMAVGVPGAAFAKDANGSAMLCKLVANVTDVSDMSYESTALTWTKRGQLLAAHAFAEDEYIAGRFINLFDAKLTVTEYALVPANDSALYWDITDLDLSIPRLGFAGGTLLGDKTETAETTSFTLRGPDSAVMSARILCKDGTYPQTVTVTNSRGKAVEFECEWNNETDSLLIQTTGQKNGVTVTVTWGTTPMKDNIIEREEDGFLPTDTTFEQYAEQYASYKKKTFVLNTQNADESITVKDTSKCNGSLKYCDLESQIVYGISLNDYPDATVVMEIAQNYVISVSTDQKKWTVVQNYEKVQGMRIESAANKCAIAIDCNEYADGEEILYIRLANTNTAYGWGGAIYRLNIYYK